MEDERRSSAAATSIGPSPAQRAVIWVVALAAVASIWGHYRETGGSTPAAPQELVLTRTWEVVGWLPWLESTPESGWRWHLSGLALGLALTAVAALATRVLLHPGRRSPATG